MWIFKHNWLFILFSHRDYDYLMEIHFNCLFKAWFILSVIPRSSSLASVLVEAVKILVNCKHFFGCHGVTLLQRFLLILKIEENRIKKKRKTFGCRDTFLTTL